MHYQFSRVFFFSLLTDIHLIFGTLICHTTIQIKFEFGFDPLIFHEDLEKYHELPVLWTFLSLLTGINLIFGTLFCHTKLQIKIKFGFYPFEFHEVLAHGLRKTLYTCCMASRGTVKLLSRGRGEDLGVLSQYRKFQPVYPT
jgi:hypothetical protein